MASRASQPTASSGARSASLRSSYLDSSSRQQAALPKEGYHRTACRTASSVPNARWIEAKLYPSL